MRLQSPACLKSAPVGGLRLHVVMTSWENLVARLFDVYKELMLLQQFWSCCRTHHTQWCEWWLFVWSCVFPKFGLLCGFRVCWRSHLLLQSTFSNILKAPAMAAAAQTALKGLAASVKITARLETRNLGTSQRSNHNNYRNSPRSYPPRKYRDQRLPPPHRLRTCAARPPRPE